MLASDVDDAMLEGKGLEAYLAASALRHAQSAPPLGSAKLGSCAFSGRAWQLWAPSQCLSCSSRPPSIPRPLTIQALNNADLISECCHSASILSGHRVDDLTAQACRDFGKDLATAQQLVAEAEQAHAATTAPTHSLSPTRARTRSLSPTLA
tara:strand:- start:97 stop:552 length:456 start_codon:yes stop_codon:yes gene_type:complete